MKNAVLFLFLFTSGSLTPLFAEDGLKSVIGTTQGSEAPLIGIFYDFKQTQKREPAIQDRLTFELKIKEFIDKEFDEGLLKGYYRVPHPLYTTEIWVDSINADDGPKVYGAEKTVQPH